MVNEWFPVTSTGFAGVTFLTKDQECAELICILKIIGNNLKFKRNHFKGVHLMTFHKKMSVLTKPCQVLSMVHPVYLKGFFVNEIGTNKMVFDEVRVSWNWWDRWIEVDRSEETREIGCQNQDQC